MALRPVPSPGDADDTTEREVRCPLGECDGSGWLVDEDSNTARPCACRDERIRRAAGAGVGLGIGRRFLEVSFEREPLASLEPAIVRHVRGYIRSLEDNLEAGRGLWFDGPVGTGKTSLAILVAKAARDAGRSYAVYPVPRLLAELKRTYDRDSTEGYLQVFQRLCSVDLLVLDDLGAEKQTEWVLEQLYSIVNERWQDERTIVVTSNVPDGDADPPLKTLREEASMLKRMRESSSLERLPQLVERLEATVGRLEHLELENTLDPISRLRKQVGSRTVSRLIEMCDDPIPIEGPDLRMSARGA
jgi:DNA replication protein DnaC